MYLSHFILYKHCKWDATPYTTPAQYIKTYIMYGNTHASRYKSVSTIKYYDILHVSTFKGYIKSILPYNYSKISNMVFVCMCTWDNFS